MLTNISQFDIIQSMDFDIAHAKSLLFNSLTSTNTITAYSKNIAAFEIYITVHNLCFDRNSILAYRKSLLDKGLAPNTINLSLSAIRSLAEKAVDAEMITEEEYAKIKRVKNVAKKGRTTGYWMTTKETAKLISDVDSKSLKGIRDKAILALMVATGLRRAEVCSLETSQLQKRMDRWVLIDVKGKGNRIRTIPVPDWVVPYVFTWIEKSGIGEEGTLFRGLSYMGTVLKNRSLSESAIYAIVREHGEKCGIDKLRPHNMRRTYARLSHEANSDMLQLSISLGHENSKTTELYVGRKQKLEKGKAPCDYWSLKFKKPTKAMFAYGK